MSNYPDNMNWSAYDAAYGDGTREYPSWDEIAAIARKHLEPAFRAMAAEIQKCCPTLGHEAFPEADLKNLIDWTISDGVTDATGSDFCDAVNNEE